MRTETRLNTWLSLGVFLSIALVRLAAADIAGTWTASFDSAIGMQEYRYVFVVEGNKLTGTATGNVVGESPLDKGKVEGDRITFVETGRFMGNDFRIEYIGTIVSADEIKFTRKVIGLVSTTEEIVAKRKK